MLLLDRFAVLMYDGTSESTEENDSRKKLITLKSRTLENIPSTRAALPQHIKRTCYQETCWNQALAWIQKLQRRLTGAGRRKQLGGSYFGRLSLKHHNRAMN